MNNHELRSILEDQVTRLLSENIKKIDLEKAESGASQSKLWHRIEENGLERLLVSEDLGGVGGGWREAEVIMRAVGKYLAPLPLVESILAGWFLSGVNIEMPTGSISIAPVRHDEKVNLIKSGTKLTIAGGITRIPWGRNVDHLVVFCFFENNPYLALVQSNSWEVKLKDTNIAAEPRDSLVLDGPVVSAAPLGQGINPDWLFAFGAVARSAQIVGALEKALEQSVSYANERSQFGAPIGKFQAVQQELARMAGEVAAAGASVEAACQAIDQNKNEAGLEIAAAKIRASEAASIVAGIAHQTHGAMGFTYEHSLHFTTRRLWSWRAEFGSESFWAEFLGRSIAKMDGRQLWSHIASRG